MYATDIIKLMNWFNTRQSTKSEFVCSVCGEKFEREMAEEFNNLTFRSGAQPIPTGPLNALQIGLIWTCSDRCRVTYTLQNG